MRLTNAEKQYRELLYTSKILDIAVYMIDYKSTIRQAADEFCMPKSTVHDWIHKKLKYSDSDKYHEVLRILKCNKQDATNRATKASAISRSK